VGSATASPNTNGCWRASTANRHQPLADAVAELDRAQAWLANMDAEHTRRHLGDLGRLAGLGRRGREQRRWLAVKLVGDTERAADVRHLTQHLQQRQQKITAIASEHHELEASLAQLVAAIDHTRPTASERSQTTRPSTWSSGSGRRPPH
jgi:hypothetical protein